LSFLERVDQTIRRSAVWRSLFRNPYPTDERSRAYAVMNNVFLHLHPVRVRQHAVKFAYTFCLGGLSFFLFLVLTVTGVYLMFFYVPSATSAYTDILNIQSRVAFGLLTRNVHRWGAHLMVFFVFLHMMRVFYHGAYKPPREFNWVIGVLLLLMTIALSFTGYLLPWDQISYWAITIGLNMASTRPSRTSSSAASRSVRTRCSASTCSTSWCCRSSPRSSLRSISGGFARTAASRGRCSR
jgi:quinol-cytochrome oxidoreductase complex cytochrome b subunit